MDASIEILSPDKEITIRGGAERVTVRELAWPDAKKLLTRLASYADLFTATGDNGATEIDPAKLAGVIIGAVGEELAVAATGKDLAWFNALSFTDAVTIIDTAGELNLRVEMLQRAKNVVSRLAALTKAPTAT